MTNIFFLLIYLLISCNKQELKTTSYDTQPQGDTFVKHVIASQTQYCRYNSPINCVKPINVPNSGIAALEVVINDSKTFRVITYDSHGRQTPIREGFVLRTRFKAINPIKEMDVTIEPDTAE